MSVMGYWQSIFNAQMNGYGAPDAAGTIPIPDPDTAAATARELVEGRMKLLESCAADSRKSAARYSDMARSAVASADRDERAAAGLREYLKTMEG